jgi:hypothetical protein
MFSFLNKINFPKKMIMCLIILVIILYFTGFFNKKEMPFEHYSNSEETQGLDDFTDTLNLKI